MKTFTKSLALTYFAVATVGSAQSINAPSTAPSAVNAISPLTPPLAGTLFFAREQRDRLDRARKFGAISVEGDSNEPAPTMLNGFVKRSDGQSAIWVDGRPRFNVQSEDVRRLQPQDVGGSSQTIRVLVPGGAENMPTFSKRPKNAKKQVSRRVAAKSAVKK